MKKLLVIVPALVAASLLSGCTAGRPLNSQDRAAILGASMNQALQNAHDAAYGQNGYKTEEQEEQEQYRYNQSRHHHKRHNDVFGDLEQDNGVVYDKHGRKGYLDADGVFHAY